MSWRIGSPAALRAPARRRLRGAPKQTAPAPPAADSADVARQLAADADPIASAQPGDLYGPRGGAAPPGGETSSSRSAGSRLATRRRRRAPPPTSPPPCAASIEPTPPKAQKPQNGSPREEEARQGESETIGARRQVSARARLGHGGMATSSSRRDAELDRPVAVELLADIVAGDAAFRERFLREARLAARLWHPNVVSVYDAGEDATDGPTSSWSTSRGSTLAELGQAAARRGCGARAPGLPRPRARARRRARAPRREAAEPAPARGRDGQGRRLRDRARRREHDRAHPGRHGARHRGLPLARAGARRGGDRRRGRLLARRRALRAADRPAAVRVRLARRPGGQADVGPITPVGELAPGVPPGSRTRSCAPRPQAGLPADSAAEFARELGGRGGRRCRPTPASAQRRTGSCPPRWTR